MEQLTFRNMKFREFVRLYYHDMNRDFPKDEIRPFWSIALLLLKKQYLCAGIWKKGKLIAYANLLRSNLSPCAMLDYFAVIPSERNGGYGSKFLTALKKYPLDGIILETEMPEKAVDEADRIKRERRIAFYERNGARRTNVTGTAFDVSYHILYLPIQKDYSDKKIKHELEHIYQLAVPEKMYKKHVHISLNK
ncbi:GNAT family N-acetyltransferase [Velocimicrobium porci]|uniref:GNAT family N-acetyltransferase n=1 Tax=Velocimicrobium porci TaxID=2606634 RepID=A0A6L5Y056_9FIRM|nr:GNAT family N-acetyltransferase [Velocimicrobium porci]MSS64362.1 GNAT family N-acetyltransferase [Velocimicrobium porci]